MSKKCVCNMLDCCGQRRSNGIRFPCDHSSRSALSSTRGPKPRISNTRRRNIPHKHTCLARPNLVPDSQSIDFSRIPSPSPYSLIAHLSGQMLHLPGPLRQAQARGSDKPLSLWAASGELRMIRRARGSHARTGQDLKRHGRCARAPQAASGRGARGFHAPRQGRSISAIVRIGPLHLEHSSGSASPLLPARTTAVGRKATSPLVVAGGRAKAVCAIRSHPEVVVAAALVEQSEILTAFALARPGVLPVLTNA